VPAIELAHHSRKLVKAAFVMTRGPLTHLSCQNRPSIYDVLFSAKVNETNHRKNKV